jgi:hypothetical protein
MTRRAAAEAGGDAPALSWETALPLFSATMQRQWAGAMAATAGVMCLILGVVFLVQGEWDAMLPMAAAITACTGGLWVLGLLVMALLFRGSMRVRYTVSAAGLRCELVDRVARGSHRAALVLGALSGRAQLVGSGLIGLSRETEQVSWKGAFRARFDDRRHSILFRSGWRTLLWVQCTPDNYARVKEEVSRRMASRGTAARVRRASPLPGYAGRSVLLVVGCLPVFAVAEEFDAGLLLPLLMLCFGLATVWLVNLFAWVVLGSLGVLAALVAASLLELRQSLLFRGESYRRWEVLDGADVSLLAVGALGAALLVWLCLGALRGRWLAALVADADDMG